MFTSCCQVKLTWPKRVFAILQTTIRRAEHSTITMNTTTSNTIENHIHIPNENRHNSNMYFALQRSSQRVEKRLPAFRVVLEHVSEFKYLANIFVRSPEEEKCDTEFEHRKVNGNKVVAQPRSHVFNKRVMSEEQLIRNLSVDD